MIAGVKSLVVVSMLHLNFEVVLARLYHQVEYMSVHN